MPTLFDAAQTSLNQFEHSFDALVSTAPAGAPAAVRSFDLFKTDFAALTPGSLPSTTFRPQDYAGGGYVFGIDPVGDMTLIQQAADAAMNVAGGTLALGGVTYALAEHPDPAKRLFNTWVHYITAGFNFTKPLRIEGENAIFKLARMPVLYPGSNTGFNLLHMGIGYDIWAAGAVGFNYGWTEAEWDAIWKWSHGYILRDLNTDCSVLTPAELARLSNGVTGGLLELAGVGYPLSQGADAALIENFHADVSWGVIGVGCNARSNRLTFRNITVDKVYKVAGWFDGLRDGLIDGFEVGGAHPSAVSPAGVGLEPNTDCGMTCRDTTMQNMHIRGMKTGVGFGGINSLLKDSIIEMPVPTVSPSPTGIYLGAEANSRGAYSSVGGSIQNCQILRSTSDQSYGSAFLAAGKDAGQYGIAYVDGVNVHDNLVGDSSKKISYPLRLGKYVKNLQFINNDLWTASHTLPVDESVGTSPNNTFSPNTVH